MSEIRVRVWRVGRRSESQYLLILRDDSGNPLMMVIGACEAVAIWTMLSSQAGAKGLEAGTSLPMTHDLMGSIIGELGGKLEKVVVDDLWKGVYYAKLHLAVDGQRVTVDARPSDAVALALRAGASLFVTEAVMAASREPESEADTSETGPDSGIDLGEL